VAAEKLLDFFGGALVDVEHDDFGAADLQAQAVAATVANAG
jgi:hypothetical protein